MKDDPLSACEGRLEGILGSLVYGWARDPRRPERPLVVELLADDYPVAVTRARLFDAELGPVRGEHAFAAHLPEPVLASGACIRARIANTDLWLDGELPLADPAAEGRPPLEGRVRHDGGLLVYGKALDPLNHGQPLEVACFLGERPIAHTRTRSPSGTFSLLLPLGLADGRCRDIRVEAEGRELAGSPLRLCTRPRGPLALLKQLLDTTDTQVPEAGLETLQRVLAEYERRLPQCVRFADYDPWWRLQQTPPTPSTAGCDAPMLVFADAGGAPKTLLDTLSIQSDGNWRALLQGITEADCTDDRVRPLPPSPLKLAQLLEPKDRLVVVLERGMIPSPRALDHIAAAFRDPEVQALYTDSDRLDDTGRHHDPWLKPAWDYERFLGQDYLHGLFAVRAELLAESVAEHPDDLVFAAVERLLSSPTGSKIHHLPQVLCHRLPGFAATPAGDARRLEQVRQLLDRVEPGAELVPHPGGFTPLRRIKRPLAKRPLVSLIVPTRDHAELLERCVSSIERHTRYRPYEILILDNDSREPRTHALLEELSSRGHRVLACPGPFNFAALNNRGVEQVSGEVIGLLNNDLELPADSGEWLEEMLALLLRPGVGAVGAKLLWSNGMVQHAGVVLGVGGLAAHAGPLWQAHEAGYRGRNQLTQEVAAVTAACLLTRRSDYLNLGGMDAARFPVNFNDLDYCLRLAEKGLKILWTPFAPLLHHESASRGQDRELPEKQARAQWEMFNLRQRWVQRLAHDPAYHPDLTLDSAAGPYGGLALVSEYERRLR